MWSYGRNEVAEDNKLIKIALKYDGSAKKSEDLTKFNEESVTIQALLA